MADLGGRYAAFTTRLVERVLTTPGHSATELRRTVLARAAGASFPPSGTERGTGGEDPLSGMERESGSEAVPAALATYVDKVARHAYKVTDEDVTALQRAGTSDDALFELTVSAALGAALGRLERGLAALRSEPRSVSERGEERVSSPPVPLSTSSSPPDPLSTLWRGGTKGKR